MEWVLAALVLGADIWLKRYAAEALSMSPVEVIPGVLSLVYTENRGAAWGMLQGARVLFIVLTAVFLVLVLVFHFRHRKELGGLSRVILALLFSGALGNFIDRLVLGYVRDMIYFSLIDFPVFNLADSAIVIAAGLLIIETLSRKKGIFDIAEKALTKKRNCGN